MLALFVAIFALGLVAGLRVFTAPAVLWLMRHTGPWAIVLAVLALVEYAGDLYPKAPARTSPPGLIARMVSGIFVGWSLAASAGAPASAGALVGLAGAVAGAYGGLALRVRAMAMLGSITAALCEDVVAIGLAVLAVAHAAS
ncbi:MAG: hypothetical protein WB615_00685 [Candidatus Tumulicola sp.]